MGEMIELEKPQRTIDATSMEVKRRMGTRANTKKKKNIGAFGKASWNLL